jgi:hypothetical protein
MGASLRSFTHPTKKSFIFAGWVKRSVPISPENVVNSYKICCNDLDKYTAARSACHGGQDLMIERFEKVAGR